MTLGLVVRHRGSMTLMQLGPQILTYVAGDVKKRQVVTTRQVGENQVTFRLLVKKLPKVKLIMDKRPTLESDQVSANYTPINEDCC